MKEVNAGPFPGAACFHVLGSQLGIGENIARSRRTHQSGSPPGYWLFESKPQTNSRLALPLNPF